MNKERDHGPQPLSEAMAERGLKPADLVKASLEQITHKMVNRAMNGRRLTRNTMDKVVNAYNLVCDTSATHRELFNYAAPSLMERRGNRASSGNDQEG
jgi:hypothetical protein